MTIEKKAIKEVNYNPIKPVEEYLEDAGLTAKEVKDLTALYREYRSPKPDKALSQIRLSSYTGDQWSRKIFDERLRISSQIDQIGQDFLRQIGFRISLGEYYNYRGVEEAIKVLKAPIAEIWTPQIAEALSDLLSYQGIYYKTRSDRRIFAMFSDFVVSQAHKGSVGIPIEWLIDTANYSRYLRRVEVSFQDEENISTSLDKFSPEDYNIPPYVIIKTERAIPVTNIVRAIVLCSELGLLEPGHRTKLPPLQMIAESVGAEYSEILRSERDKEKILDQHYLTALPPSIVRMISSEIKEIRETGSISELTQTYSNQAIVRNGD